MTGSAMDPMAVKCFDPMGALGVRILRGSGLPKKSGLRTLIGQHKPDAYAKIQVGATMYETDVVKNTTEPEWDGKWLVLFIVHVVLFSMLILVVIKFYKNVRSY